MKAKSLIVLIVILAVVAVCTGISVAYIVNKNGSELALTQNGEAVSEDVSFDSLIPGDSRTTEYNVENSGTSEFSVTFTGNTSDALVGYITVAFALNGENVAQQSLADCLNQGFTAQVSGDFSFALTYTFDLSAGPDVMGATADIVVSYALN